MFNSYDNIINPQYSAWTNFPSDKDPFALYKYASVEINLNKDLAMINRQTYSMLDWLGDCGGLLEALFFISDMFFAPFMIFKVRQRLNSLIVSLMPSEDANKNSSADNKK